MQKWGCRWVWALLGVMGTWVASGSRVQVTVRNVAAAEYRAQTHTVGKGSRTEAWEGGTGKKVDTGLGTERSTKGCILPLGGGWGWGLHLFRPSKRNKKKIPQTKTKINPKHHIKLRER